VYCSDKPDKLNAFKEIHNYQKTFQKSMSRKTFNQTLKFLNHYINIEINKCLKIYLRYVKFSQTAS